MPIVRVDERHWMAHPCGYRTLFHGVEMALVSDEDESSSEDEADEEEEKGDENKESNDQEKTEEEPSTSTTEHVQ